MRTASLAAALLAALVCGRSQAENGGAAANQELTDAIRLHLSLCMQLYTDTATLRESIRKGEQNDDREKYMRAYQAFMKSQDRVFGQDSELTEKLHFSRSAGLEAFERIFLNEYAEKNRLVPEAFRPYLTVATLRLPWIGRDRVTTLLKDRRLSARQRMDLLDQMPVDSNPADWMDDRLVASALTEAIDNTDAYKVVSIATSLGSRSTTLRFCDRASELASQWYAPKNIPRFDPFTDEKVRDESASAMREWLRARSRKIESREKLYEMLERYHTLKLDRGAVRKTLDSWLALDDREPGAAATGRPPSIKVIEQLSRLLLAELSRWSRSGVTPSADERAFVQEVTDTLSSQFQLAGVQVAPHEKPFESREAAHHWICDQVKAASTTVQPAARTTWEVFFRQVELWSNSVQEAKPQ